MNVCEIALDLGQRPASVTSVRPAGRPKSDPVDFRSLLPDQSSSPEPCSDKTEPAADPDAVGGPGPDAPVSDQPVHETEPAPGEDALLDDMADVAELGEAVEVAAAMTPVVAPVPAPSQPGGAALPETPVVVSNGEGTGELSVVAVLDAASAEAHASGRTPLTAAQVLARAAVPAPTEGDLLGTLSPALRSGQDVVAAFHAALQKAQAGTLAAGTEDQPLALAPPLGEQDGAAFLRGLWTNAATGLGQQPSEELDAAALLRGLWANAAAERPPPPTQLAQAIAEEGHTAPAGTEPARADAPPPRAGVAPPPAAATEVDGGVRSAPKADGQAFPPERVNLEVVREFTVRSVRYLVTRGERTITVKLVPESLGELHLEVTSAKEGLFVRLVSANPAVREFLSEEAHHLRVALAANDLETVDVTVSGDRASGHATGEGRTPGWVGRDGAPDALATEPDAPAQAVAIRPEPSLYGGALNVFV